MKLFVWNNPYSVFYGSSLVFAVAETEEQARQIAKQSAAYTFGEYGNFKHVQDMKLGEPIRVLEPPCAEWHEWSE